MRKFRIVGWSLILAASAMSLLAGVVLAATSETVDPATIDFAILLTAGGIPIAGAIVSSILEVAKRLPLVPGNESAFSMIIDAVLIVIAFITTGAELNLVSGFMTFMAWINLAGFTSAFYDKALKPSGAAEALSGQSS